MIWAYYESFSDDIDLLLKHQLIIKNKNAQWYEDRDRALEELEKKYDSISDKDESKDIIEDNSNNQIIIDQNDSTEELLLKAQILSEMIESRQKQISDNNDAMTYVLSPNSKKDGKYDI